MSMSEDHGNASVDIDTGDLLAGDLPPRVRRAVQELLRAHRAEALEAFRAAFERRPFDTLEDEGGR